VSRPNWGFSATGGVLRLTRSCSSFHRYSPLNLVPPTIRTFFLTVDICVKEGARIIYTQCTRVRLAHLTTRDPSLNATAVVQQSATSARAKDLLMALLSYTLAILRSKVTSRPGGISKSAEFWQHQDSENSMQLKSVRGQQQQQHNSRSSFRHISRVFRIDPGFACDLNAEASETKGLKNC
jgi:hypothetical protein